MWPFLLAAAGLLSVVSGAVIAWARDARSLVPGRALATAPFYVLWKIPLYLGFARGGETSWVRTPRASGSGGKASS
jgi:hypothetical protein